jgi:hypothetical protein
MIRMSEFGRRYQGLTRRVATAAAATVALVLAAVCGCGIEGEHHSPMFCTLIGCLNGLTVGFDGNFDPQVTYLFDISEVISPSETAPMASCTRAMPSNDVLQINCTTTREVTSDGDSVRFPNDVNVHKIVVTVSKVDGATVPLGSQTLEPVVTSAEINGPGCGVCTSARAGVTIP